MHDFKAEVTLSEKRKDQQETTKEVEYGLSIVQTCHNEMSFYQ